MAGYRKLGSITRSLTGILNLRRYRGGTGIAHHSHFLRRWPDVEAATPAVVAYAIVRNIRDRVVVDVVNHVDIHIRHGAVVIQSALIPISAIVSAPGITEAVIDAAVEANVGAPITTVPAVVMAIVAPVGRRPKGVDPGHHDPGAWHPIIARGCVRPVSWSPVIVVARGLGLAIFRERRRRIIRFDNLGA